MTNSLHHSHMDRGYVLFKTYGAGDHSNKCIPKIKLVASWIWINKIQNLLAVLCLLRQRCKRKRNRSGRVHTILQIKHLIGTFDTLLCVLIEDNEEY